MGPGRHQLWGRGAYIVPKTVFLFQKIHGYNSASNMQLLRNRGLGVRTQAIGDYNWGLNTQYRHYYQDTLKKKRA